jgi:ureidoacrylate peracid hydrolase
MDPSRTALLNIDMQNCFVENSPTAPPDGRALLEKINGLTAACRSAGILVIHAMHVLRKDRSNAGILLRSPLICSGMIDEGSFSAALHSDLLVDPDDIVVVKPRFGAFHGTDLEMILRTRGIETVLVSGISTSVCCETTAREAAVRDFEVVFIEDATATFPIGNLSADEVKRATCATIGFVFGRVATLDEVYGELNG